MEVTNIPFAKTIGLKRNGSGTLELGFVDGLMNHVQTVAAAAQFSLAELASGEHLLQLFPELIGKAIPVLRDSRLKYRKPAKSEVSAHPSTKDKAVTRFREQYEKKGRGLISIDVEIRDTAGIITSAGSFSWYIQRK